MKTVVLGASGFVGRQLALAGLPGDVVRVGRSPDEGPDYHRVDAYDERSIRPLLGSCDVLLHLAAVTRGRREAQLRAANVDLVSNVMDWLHLENRGARVILFSTDLAAYSSSPYGRSKQEAEAILERSGTDAVTLRASLMAGRPDPDRPSTMASLKATASKRIALLPGKGRFTVRPLWIDDVANVITRLAERRGREADRGVWSMRGDPIRLHELVIALSEVGGTRPTILGLPVKGLIAAGKVLTTLAPSSRFPLDFLEAVADGEADQPPDIFGHLGLTKTPTADFLGKL